MRRSRSGSDWLIIWNSRIDGLDYAATDNLAGSVKRLSETLSSRFNLSCAVLDSASGGRRHLLRVVREALVGAPGAVVVFIGPATEFQRSGDSFISVGVGGSVRGRPSSMVPLNDLASTVTDTAPDGRLILDLSYRSSRRTVPDVVPPTGRAWAPMLEFPKVLAWRCIPAEPDPRQDLWVDNLARRAQISSDLGEPISLPVALIDQGFAVLPPDQRTPGDPVTTLPATRSSPRFDSGLVEDLYSDSVGSRLDAVADLAGLISDDATTDDHMIDEARAVLRQLIHSDPSDAVRSSARRCLEQTTRVSFGQLLRLDVLSPAVLQQVTCWPFPAFEIVEAGRYKIGVDPPHGQNFEQPAFTVHLPTFRVSLAPIRVGEYARYLAHNTDAAIPDHWDSDAQIHSTAHRPVVGVSLYDALAYCRWLTAELRADGTLGTHETVGVPTEFEWEAAARGPGGSPFPWGDLFDSRRCNVASSGHGTVTDVGAIPPQRKGPTGSPLYDLIGNVWEWTTSIWGHSGREPVTRYPLGPSAPADSDYQGGVRVVVRGGAYYYYDQCGTTYTRNRFFPGDRHLAGGFRVVIRSSQQPDPELGT